MTGLILWCQSHIVHVNYSQGLAESAIMLSLQGSWPYVTKNFVFVAVMIFKNEPFPVFLEERIIPHYFVYGGTN